jgi:cholesterol transport system auxiliary component
MTQLLASRRQFGRLALLAPLLSACSNIIPGQGQAPQTYVLTPKSTFVAELPKVDWQLLVDTPVASAELDTTRIVLSRSPITIDYFGDAAWPERAPLMIQTLIVESFENTGKILAVGRETVGLRADYILKPELRHFQAVYGEGGAMPYAWVRLTVRMIKTPEGRIVAQDTFEAREPAERNAIEAVVLAFDEALGKVMKRLVAWTLAMPTPEPERRRL